MTKTYVVSLCGTSVAYLYSTSRGGTALYFDPAYQALSPRPILAQRFLEWDLTRERRFATLPSWFRNLLPEGWLRKYVTSQGPQGDEFDLSGRLGRDLPGAVEVIEADAPGKIVSAGSIDQAEPGSGWNACPGRVGIRIWIPCGRYCHRPMTSCPPWRIRSTPVSWRSSSRAERAPKESRWIVFASSPEGLASMLMKPRKQLEPS